MLVKEMDHGADLAASLGQEGRVVLLRGHGRASPFGPAILVTHDPKPTYSTPITMRCRRGQAT
jgi:hypothetical protein